MSVSLLEVIGCDSCRRRHVIEEQFKDPDKERRVLEKQGWRYKRGPVDDDGGTAMVDICPECAG